MDMELSEWAALFCCDRGGAKRIFPRLQCKIRRLNAGQRQSDCWTNTDIDEVCV